MEITLNKDVEKRLIASIQQYLTEELGQEASTLKASLFLKYCLAEIAPTIYNMAIADAQAYIQERAADLENVCFADEFSYWTKGGKGTSRKPDSHR